MRRPSSLFRLSQWLAVAAAALFAGLYVFTALPRLLYPYDLDFIEDSLLMQSLRHAQGLPVYLPPNADFVPHVYMPLYMWLGGLLFRLTGPGYVPLRALSFAATLATTLLIFGIARRESGQNWLAFACAGLYLGGYRITGFWYELARVDSLHVTLALAGFAIGIYASKSWRGMAGAAAVLALAFFTKQTSIIFAGALGLYWLVAIGRRAWAFAGWYAAFTALPLLAINLATGGAFWAHIFGLATAEPLEAARVAQYVWVDVLFSMGGLSGLAIAAAVLGARRAGWRWIGEQPWAFGLAAAFVVSGLGRAPAGGNVNNLMLVYALLCLSPALLAREMNLTPRPPLLSPKSGAQERRSLGQGFVALAVLIQFALGAYNPWRYIPTDAMRQSGDRFIQRLASIDGDVLVLMHPYYTWLAGKTPSTQIIHLWYFYHYHGLPLPEDFVSRIRRREYTAIISDESLFETEPVVRDLIEAYYRPAERLTEADAPPTMTGIVVRPQVIYVPKE